MATKKAVSKSAKPAVKKPVAAAKKTTVRAASASKNAPSVVATLKKRLPFIGALVAEFVGTFLLTAAVINQQGSPIVLMFAFIGIVLVIGGLSGAHINPAVTIAAWVTRKINWMRATGYVLVQFLGALTALGLLNAFLGAAEKPSAEALSYGQTAAQLFQANALVEGKEWYVFFAELVGTLILGFVVANAITVARKTKDVTRAALTVGFGIFVALVFAGSAAAYAGGSTILNPAVALSLEALDWKTWPLAVYVLAPVVGAVLGFLLNDFLQAKNDGGND